MYKYLELKDLRVMFTVERVDCSKLTKKELRYFLSLELTNESFRIDYEEYKFEQDEIFDRPYNIIRKHLNRNFPLKYLQNYEY